MAAAVLRVKRRRCDDPAEALYLSCVSKRPKRESPADENDEEVTSVLRLAATVSTKDEPVYSRIQHAISKEQLQREFKQHAVDIRGRMRMEKRDSMQAGRYKVVSRHRELESCDSPQGDCENSGAGAKASVSPSADVTDSKATVKTQVSEDRTAGAMRDATSGGSGGAGSHDSGSDSVAAGERAVPGEEGRGQRSSIHAEGQGSAASREGSLWIYDVEVDPQETLGSRHRRALAASLWPYVALNAERPSPVLPSIHPPDGARGQAAVSDPHAQLSDIMCNGARMVTTNEAPNSDYVYDLYYTTEGIGSEATVEGMRIEAYLDLLEYRNTTQEQEVASDVDSDDSNAEDNWRNDYPEEEELEDSVEEDFEGNSMYHSQRAGFDPEDADPDYANLPQSVVNQLYMDGSSYGGGRKYKIRDYFSSFDCESEDDNEEASSQGYLDDNEEEIDYCD